MTTSHSNRPTDETIVNLLTNPKTRLNGRVNRYGATVTAQNGCDDYLFTYHEATGTWRLGSITTYGNYSGVYGPGCDASGLVITDEFVMTILDGAF